jgi:glycosyltransferase involved in cell wall biosynthesis
MRFHVLSLPHTSTTAEYISCAYTSKAKNFANMMISLGHEVFLYSGPENEANCTEHIPIASHEDQYRWFGKPDFHTNFYPITWAGTEPHWTESNANAIREIGKRIKPRDFVCVIAGWCQKPITDAFPANMGVEYGIGYTGVYADYKVFESYAHMHWVYGNMKDDNGKFYDCVIPNYFNPDEFKFQIEPEDPPYYLWLGRFIERKGPEIAVEVTRRLGDKLIMAGQGVQSNATANGVTTLVGDNGFTLSGDHITHVGHVGVSERATLLAGAKATFMPTTYLEPFGGVSIESMLSGTPVIATDFGVFSETVVHGLAGYRFRTIGEATQFASDEMLNKLDRRDVQDYAISNFSMDVVRFRYQDYFEQLLTLWEDGFYSTKGTSDDRYTRY